MSSFRAMHRRLRIKTKRLVFLKPVESAIGKPCLLNLPGCVRNDPKKESALSKTMPACYACRVTQHVNRCYLLQRNREKHERFFDLTIPETKKPLKSPACKGHCTFVLDRRFEGNHGFGCFVPDRNASDTVPEAKSGNWWDEEQLDKPTVSDSVDTSNLTTMVPENQYDFSHNKPLYDDMLPQQDSEIDLINDWNQWNLLDEEPLYDDLLNYPEDQCKEYFDSEKDGQDLQRNSDGDHWSFYLL